MIAISVNAGSTLDACSLSILLESFPVHTKMCDLTSRMKVSPWFMADHEMSASCLRIG